MGIPTISLPNRPTIKTTSCIKASNGQWFPCTALPLFSKKIFLFFLVVSRVAVRWRTKSFRIGRFSVLIVHPFVRLSICPFNSLSICPFVHLSVCPFIHLSIFPLSVFPLVHSLFRAIQPGLRPNQPVLRSSQPGLSQA